MKRPIIGRYHIAICVACFRKELVHNECLVSDLFFADHADDGEEPNHLALTRERDVKLVTALAALAVPADSRVNAQTKQEPLHIPSKSFATRCVVNRSVVVTVEAHATIGRP